VPGITTQANGALFLGLLVKSSSIATIIDLAVGFSLGQTDEYVLLERGLEHQITRVKVPAIGGELGWYGHARVKASVPVGFSWQEY
jgi:hypothetical protein